MPRKGRRAELAAEALERLLSEDPDHLIESPGYLTDQLTGSNREFDVVVTKAGEVRAVEVRDRGAVVGVGEIEAFVTKTRDSGVKDAVFVSTRGFGGPALAKAHHYGIHCYTLKTGERGYWSNAPPMEVRLARRVAGAETRMEFYVYPEENPEPISAAKVVLASGAPADLRAFARDALAFMNRDKGSHLERTGRAWATVALRPREVFCRNVPDDRLLPLCKAIVHIQVDIVVEKFPTEAIGLYSADQDGAAPEAELFVCPKATRALGLPPGSLGIGARVGGALKLLMMRDPEDSHDET